MEPHQTSQTVTVNKHREQNGGRKNDGHGSPQGNVNSRRKNVGLSWMLPIVAMVAVPIGGALLCQHDAVWYWLFHLRDFIPAAWGRFYDYFDGNWSTMGLALIFFLILEYWVLGCLFLVTDLTGWPSFISKFKVQEEQTNINRGKLFNAMLTVFVNQTVFNLPNILIIDHLMRWRGCGHSVDDLPTIPGVLVEFVVFTIIEEIGFYYGHRLLHHPSMYSWFHKKHHEWTAPIGLITVYCHPLENFLANTAPVVVGPVLMGSHLLTTSAWVIVAQTVAIIHHSGYHIPFLPSPEAHDFHHLKFTSNFGVLGILDWLHGTDANFRKTKQFQRHYTLLGFTPVNDVIPTNPKQIQSSTD